MPQKLSPFYTLFFLIVVLAVLGAISFIFPEDGIAVSKSIKIKFPTINNILSGNKPRYAPIPQVAFKADSISMLELKKQELIAKQQAEIISEIPDTSNELAVTDTTPVKKAPRARVKKEQPPIQKTEIKSQKIEFAAEDASVLYPFFKKLDASTTANNSLRIVHYGDSQIEGDRISGFIRERLQSRFGGGGCGLLPALKIYNQASASQSNSGDWQRYTVFGKIDKALTHNSYGAMCAFSRFTPLNKTLDEPATASVKFNTAPSIYPTAKKFERIKIYYGNNGGVCDTQILTNNNHFATVSLEGNDILNVQTIEFDVATDNAELIFKGANSPDIYGISLDNDYGISVDNIAMRGSSGTIFNKMNKPLLSAMLKDLNTGLIIMQFGGNVMPFMKSKKACEEYGNWFYSQIATLKSAAPGASIIVIGPADMSVKQDEYYVTYPLLEDVRDALKNAAFKAGAGFWDMYSAMGGKNSMPSWVAARPQLAGSDYVHFTPKGARIIAELFYEALNHEYENYRYKNANTEK